MKRDDPYTRIQRQPLLTLSITLPLLTLVAFFQAINPRNDLFLKVISLVACIIPLLVGVFAIFRYRLNLKRLDQQRERALQGDKSLLAKEQPLADPNTYLLPTTIKLDQSRRIIVFLSVGTAFAVFLPFVIGIVVGSRNSHHSFDNHALLLTVLIILGGALVALLIAVVLIIFLARNQLNFTIVVDERGFSSSYQGITSTISWSDARLFAVLNPEKPLSMRFYELSNENTMVCWVNMPTRTLFQRRENMAYAEYRHKVQVLLAFIVARTGLPLYDLSSSSSAKARLR